VHNNPRYSSQEPQGMYYEQLFAQATMDGLPVIHQWFLPFNAVSRFVSIR